ncbi:hypothetical protein B0T17DRAFT_511640 [Bombardia bombarda]|uniref:Uncharacterized protein n=1 Tax=Bombardia bombarda TaxID=252184 RepID=A0AA39WBK1_9PEZI|nr:hypothetical protein B0T17DRAFT_511640 [Bombardia bombarda]
MLQAAVALLLIYLINNSCYPSYSSLCVREMFESFEVNNPEQRDLQQRCVEWFTSHLQEQLLGGSPSLATALAPMGGKATDAVDVAVLLDFVKAMAEEVTKSNIASISNIVRELRNKGNILAPEREHDGACHQAVFIACGWISMLYKPKPKPAGALLEIYPTTKAHGTQSSSPRFRSQDTFPSNVSAAEYGMLSFGRLLAALGQRLPQRQFTGGGSPVPVPPINASNIYFSNLVRVGKVHIEWVDCLTEHLVLDERTRTLKLFRYPAYCALICLSAPGSVAFLNKLADDVDHDTASLSSLNTTASQQPPFENFCREILISFGVIFAQDSRSRNESKKDATVAAWPARIRDDVVFRKLRAKSWQEHTLFTYLNSPPLRSNYSAQSDFPFLGAKLLRLQEYMDAQTPTTFGPCFGVISIGLGVLQVALMVLQIGLDARSN